LRCLVVGKKVVAAMKRQGPNGEFRSNIHRGGSVKELGLYVEGVDILRSKKGPVVMEVNSSPGLEGIEKLTGKDVATSIVKYIEKKLSRIKKAKKRMLAGSKRLFKMASLVVIL